MLEFLAMSEKILTTEQASKILGVTQTRVRAMIAAGQLPSEKFGRVHMIKESDLKALRERKPGRPPKLKENREK
jgi:excisionase family DNA binding protein